jgi:hypothetical protein
MELGVQSEFGKQKKPPIGLGGFFGSGSAGRTVMSSLCTGRVTLSSV